MTWNDVAENRGENRIIWNRLRANGELRLVVFFIFIIKKKKFGIKIPLPAIESWAITNTFNVYKLFAWYVNVSSQWVYQIQLGCICIWQVTICMYVYDSMYLCNKILFWKKKGCLISFFVCIYNKCLFVYQSNSFKKMTSILMKNYGAIFFFSSLFSFLHFAIWGTIFVFLVL